MCVGLLGGGGIGFLFVLIGIPVLLMGFSAWFNEGSWHWQVIRIAMIVLTVIALK